MPKKSGKKKATASEVDSDVEIISRTKIKFEDTKAITGVDQEFKWGDIYQMIREQNVPDVWRLSAIFFPRKTLPQ